MEELESTSRHSGSRAGHLAGISINISGKVPRMLYVFKSSRGYSHSPGLGNHCSSIFLFKKYTYNQFVVLLTSVLISH